MGRDERCGQDCLVCNGEKGGNCRKRSIVYKIWCRTCAADGVSSVYVGESGNCSYERGLQHWQEFQSTNEETRAKSVLRKHVEAVHGGNEEGVEFEMKVTDVFKNDPQGRQIMEGVKMREMENKVDNIMNSKDEFQQPGEIIPTLEGAGRRNNSSQKSYNNNNNNNNRVEESARVEGDRRRRDNNKKVTNGDSRNERGTTPGVTTRARTRRQNNVV